MGNSPVVDIVREGQSITIILEGDIDLYRSRLFQDDILKIVSEKPKEIVVDLSAVPYMDSSGVASLVKLLSRTKALGIELKLRDLSVKVRSIFEITNLDTVFKIVSSGEKSN